MNQKKLIIPKHFLLPRDKLGLIPHTVNANRQYTGLKLKQQLSCNHHPKLVSFGSFIEHTTCWKTKVVFCSTVVQWGHDAAQLLLVGNLDIDVCPDTTVSKQLAINGVDYWVSTLARIPVGGSPWIKVITLVFCVIANRCGLVMIRDSSLSWRAMIFTSC